MRRLSTHYPPRERFVSPVQEQRGRTARQERSRQDWQEVGWSILVGLLFLAWMVVLSGGAHGLGVTK